MPPGTGDIQLTLAQKVPVTGAVIVTTPQDIALIDARKGLKMFEKVGVPIVGIVENMSIHICSNCGHAEHIFGEGGAEKMCADYNVPFLGGLPLDIRIREQTDSGPADGRRRPRRQGRADLPRDRAQDRGVRRAEGGGLLGEVPVASSSRTPDTADRFGADPGAARICHAGQRRGKGSSVIKSDKWIRRMAASTG